VLCCVLPVGYDVRLSHLNKDYLPTYLLTYLLTYLCQPICTLTVSITITLTLKIQHTVHKYIFRVIFQLHTPTDDLKLYTYTQYSFHGDRGGAGSFADNKM